MCHVHGGKSGGKSVYGVMVDSPIIKVFRVGGTYYVIVCKIISTD